MGKPPFAFSTILARRGKGGGAHGPARAEPCGTGGGRLRTPAQAAGETGRAADGRAGVYLDPCRRAILGCSIKAKGAFPVHETCTH